MSDNLFNGLQVNKTDWVHLDSVKAPWKAIDEASGIPFHVDYCRGSMFDAIKEVADKYPDLMALGFMDKSVSFKELIAKIDICAKALKAIGVDEGDAVSIAMPNFPQAIYMFYAVNKIGAVSNMIHPLSAVSEIEFYLNEAKSDILLTTDQFYEKLKEVRKHRPIKNLIIASVSDEFGGGPDILKYGNALPWNDFMAKANDYDGESYALKDQYDPAAIFYSGGTTGTTKGIVLSNGNFNAHGAMTIAANPMLKPGHKMLAATPIFHGYGLGVGVHAMISQGISSILVPRFTPESYAQQIIKHKCNMISGVPSLFEALLREGNFGDADLSFLVGCYSGGDSLSAPLKKRMDDFLAKHGAKIQIREGFGMTEAVTACALTPPDEFREGGIGIPFPNTYMKICRPGTDIEVPYGGEGELLIAGPSVMLGYLNNPEETKETLTLHDDGLIWLHTGDLASMDADGYLYFKGRIKRVIMSSGYSIYPAQIENIIDAHPKVHMSCVIGIDDPIRIKRLKAYIVLKQGVEPTDAVRESIQDYLEKNISKYAMPKEIEFRTEFPMTLFGKIAYRQLEAEAAKEEQKC